MCHEISVSIVLLSLFDGDLSFDVFSLVLQLMLLLICVLLGFLFFRIGDMSLVVLMLLWLY